MQFVCYGDKASNAGISETIVFGVTVSGVIMVSGKIVFGTFGFGVTVSRGNPSGVTRVSGKIVSAAIQSNTEGVGSTLPEISIALT